MATHTITERVSIIQERLENSRKTAIEQFGPKNSVKTTNLQPELHRQPRSTSRSI